jgi:acetyltransferase-like isoleucine patch superfamily enzyme
MSKSGHSADPLSWMPRMISKLWSLWIFWTYPFVSVGDRFSAHYSCELERSVATFIRIGTCVTIGRDAWINIPEVSDSREPIIILDDGCVIGRRCVISAKNRVHIERNSMFAPSALVMDHNHAFEDVTVPIIDQGTTKGGTIRIEEGCWVGFGAAIVCNEGELVIGRHSVIGANSVVTRSVPSYSVVTGNPARVVKSYDPSKGEWILGSGKVAVQPTAT